MATAGTAAAPAPGLTAAFVAAHPALPFERLPAVNGRGLTLTRELAALFAGNRYGWKKSVMGCALSHWALWQRLAAEPDAGAAYLVLEDDCVLAPNWREAWAALRPGVPADAHVVFLGGVLPPNMKALPLVAEPVAPGLARVREHGPPGGAKGRGFHFCTYSYVMTRAGAARMLEIVAAIGLSLPADHMMVGLWRHLNIYFAYPLLAGCTQDADPAYAGADFDAPSWQHTYDSDLRNNSDAFTPAEYEHLLPARRGA
jgi:GR25 family glycosyltransferase involved in LPS biosynthesis